MDRRRWPHVATPARGDGHEIEGDDERRRRSDGTAHRRARCARRCRRRTPTPTVDGCVARGQSGRRTRSVLIGGMTYLRALVPAPRRHERLSGDLDISGTTTIDSRSGAGGERDRRRTTWTAGSHVLEGGSLKATRLIVDTWLELCRAAWRTTRAEAGSWWSIGLTARPAASSEVIENVPRRTAAGRAWGGIGVAGATRR